MSFDAYPPLICLQAKGNSVPLRKFCPVENGPNRLDKKYKKCLSYFGYIKLYPSHFYLKFVSFFANGARISLNNQMVLEYLLIIRMVS